MEDKKQFDQFLGGCQSLPHEVSLMKLVASRVSEISAMTYSIENPHQTRLVFQKLPVHMRRRVMSHNVKRLPRRLQEAHQRQMFKSGPPPTNKRPSRRYRRRPRNLLLKYNRRQRDKIWLETHIWHAKRFHMIEKWKYRLASYANDKCFKANYRAAAKHCLMQDLSYYSCVEITGPENFLRETLKAHCNPSELTFNAKIYAGGNREGTLMFFERNSYPRSPIGNVQFFWRPSRLDVKSIWIWAHPAFYDDFLTEIISSFEFEPCDKNIESESVNYSKSSCYKNSNGCRMAVLKNALNRFRLYGPLTLNLLTDSLRLPKLQTPETGSEINSAFIANNSRSNLEFDSDNSLNQCKYGKESGKLIEATSKVEVDDPRGMRGIVDVDVDKTENIPFVDDTWYVRHYGDPENMESLTTQKQLWEVMRSLESPHQLPRNIILGFTVLDPRFFLPPTRTKPQKSATLLNSILTPPIGSNYSPIWEKEVREKVSKSCVSIATINKLRSNNLVPGVSNDCDFEEKFMAKVPVLFIQKPGNNGTGLYSSVDIILPANWAMPFWLAFLFRCARVGALRESRSIAFESINPRSPDVNDPDTAAYKREAVSTKEELMEKYFRYPPNRRVNFTKLGISSPFSCEWRILTMEWSNQDDFYVVRDRNLLLLLKTTVSSFEMFKNRNRKNARDTKIDADNLLRVKNCLVRVKASILNRGCPKMFATICMPTNADLEKLKRDRSWSGPVEKINRDPNKRNRKVLRNNHLIYLKRCRRRRLRHKKKFENKIREIISNNKYDVKQRTEMKNFAINSKELSRKVILEQFQKMSKLYLPDCTKVRYSCDREIMGYVTSGSFSFTEAKGIGLGFVTMQALIDMITRKSNIVLLRNIQTRQYRFARLDISVD